MTIRHSNISFLRLKQNHNWSDGSILLQEFDLEIRDKKGIENLVTDHLSRIEQEDDDGPAEIPLDDSFLDQYLMALYTNETPWYVDIVNYLACVFFSFRFLFSKKEKVLIWCKVLSMGGSYPLQILCRTNFSEMVTGEGDGNHPPTLSCKKSWWSIRPQKNRIYGTLIWILLALFIQKFIYYCRCMWFLSKKRKHLKEERNAT